MSNRLFQTVINQMQDAINRVIGVVDSKDIVMACSELNKVGSFREIASVNLMGSQDVFIVDGYVYKMFGVHNHLEYAVFVEGIDETAIRYAKILAVTLSNIKQYYDEKYDRNNFVKNMILDNILAIKNQKVDIVANILDNDISTIISNNEHIKKGKLSYKNISMAFPSNAFVKIIKIK